MRCIFLTSDQENQDYRTTQMRTTPKFRWRFYKGRPVKSMRQVPGGLKLIFVSRISGEDGEQLVIQQSDWDKYGERREVDSTRMEDIRKLVPAD